MKERSRHVHLQSFWVLSSEQLTREGLLLVKRELREVSSTPKFFDRVCFCWKGLLMMIPGKTADDDDDDDDREQQTVQFTRVRVGEGRHAVRNSGKMNSSGERVMVSAGWLTPSTRKVRQRKFRGLIPACLHAVSPALHPASCSILWTHTSSSSCHPNNSGNH